MRRNTFLIAVIFALLIAGVFLAVRENVHSMSAEDTRIKAIETYLDSISGDFIKDEQALSAQYHVPSWGCGPSSLALAHIINTKFFDNNLVITNSYDNDPVQLVTRFGFVQFDKNSELITGDHVWLELYIGKKILFIDPTIAQYGKYHKIEHRVFNIGDANFKQVLKNDYGIIDNRIRKLVDKTLAKIPVDNDPYPGMIIDPQSMDYFLDIIKLINTVNINQIPPSWKSWVSTLTAKYQ